MDKTGAFPMLRRNPLGIGLLVAWLVYLGLFAYGVDSLYAYITARLP